MNRWNVQYVLILLSVVGSSAGMELDEAHLHSKRLGVPLQTYIQMTQASSKSDIMPHEKTALNNIIEDPIDQLFNAIKDYRIDRVKNIIEHNPDVVKVYHYWPDLNEEVTPLHVAAYHGNIASLRLLLEKKDQSLCYAETKKWKHTPLHLAANKTVAKVLVFHGLQATKSKNTWDRIPFMEACDTWPQRYDVADYLLKRGGDINVVSRFYKDTMLHRTAYSNNRDHITFLLHHKAMPELCDSDGRTPLELAINRQYYETIELFKKVGIFFVSRAQCDLFKLFKHNARKLRSLELDSRYEIDIVNLLAQLLICLRLSNRCDTASSHGILVSREGITFQHASRDGLCELFGKKSIEYVEQLIDRCHTRVKTFGYAYYWNGSDFKKKLSDYQFVVAYDKDKAFDILLTAMHHSTDIFEWLLTDKSSKNGGLVFKPDLSGVDQEGSTLLHRAVRLRNKKAIEILIRNNIDLMACDNRHATALDDVYASGDQECIVAFNNAIVDKFLDTPSYVPEYKNIKKLLKVCLDAKVYLMQDPQTAILHRTILVDYEKSLFLLKNGAFINAHDDKEQSPLLCAVSEHSLIKKLVDRIILLLKYDALVTEKMIECASSDYVRDLLQQKYDEQECCLCYEHFSRVSVIPCEDNAHQDKRTCESCYGICKQKCPFCYGKLRKWIYRLDKNV